MYFSLRSFLSVSYLFPFREMVNCQRSPSILLFSTSYYLDICCSATHFQVFSLVFHSLSVWKLSCIICAIYASSCEQEQIVNPSCHGTLFTTFRHCPSRLSFTIVHAILQLCLFALANSRSSSYIYSCSTGKSLSGPSPIWTPSYPNERFFLYSKGSLFFLPLPSLFSQIKSVSRKSEPDVTKSNA